MAPPRGPRMVRTCSICFARYEVELWRLKLGRGTTCSRACSYRLRVQSPLRLAVRGTPRTTPEHQRLRKQRNGAAYRGRHRAKLAAQQAAYIRAHPEIMYMAQERRRARKMQAPVCDFTRQQWRAMKDLYGHCCAYCCQQFARLTMDHIVPLSRGGGHTWVNIVPACHSCNARKGTKCLQPILQPMLGV